jgi:predicted ATPase
MRIRGLRTLADVTLQLGGLTVLIGDNGTGKSSILEALRIARLIVGGEFINRLSAEHALAPAVSRNTSEVKLDLRVEKASRNFVYSLSFNPAARSITHEAIHELAQDVDVRSAASRSDAHPLIVRGADQLRIAGVEQSQHVASVLSVFDYFGLVPSVEGVAVVREALEGIDVHLPFEVMPGWAARATGRRAFVREPQVLDPIHRLDLFASNLANVYHHLRNSDSQRWRVTLELLQLGLGPELQDVLLPVVGGGHVSLVLELRGLGHVQAFQLSGGQLAYLAFVALVQLDQGRTLLAFDEPEHHLHPGLLGRVVQLLEDAGSRYPVVLATHSDRLLDFVPDPVSAVRVCELDSQHRMVLRQLDRSQLDKWTDRYSGLGELRAAGQLSSVIGVDEDDAA